MTNYKASLMRIYNQGRLGIKTYQSPDDGGGAGLYLNHITLFTGILLYWTTLAFMQFSALSSQKWDQCDIVLCTTAQKQCETNMQQWWNNDFYKNTLCICNSNLFQCYVDHDLAWTNL
jgi:hypothetical protein